MWEEKPLPIYRLLPTFEGLQYIQGFGNKLLRQHQARFWIHNNGRNFPEDSSVQKMMFDFPI